MALGTTGAGIQAVVPIAISKKEYRLVSSQNTTVGFETAREGITPSIAPMKSQKEGERTRDRILRRNICSSGRKRHTRGKPMLLTRAGGKQPGQAIPRGRTKFSDPYSGKPGQVESVTTFTGLQSVG